jgi:hypothetical protein
MSSARSSARAVDEFARLPADERRAFIGEAAARRGLTALVIEKDFWVCWTLRRLIEAPDVAGHLTFKGGTSLSKAYGIIRRFSEDIDLTIGRSAPLIGEVASPMEDGITGKQVERRIKALKTAAERFVAEVAMPALIRAIAEALGTNDGWELALDPDDRQNLLFRYPGAGPDEGGYVKPRIKLEFGARGEADPSQNRNIVPYVAEDFPDEIPNGATTVPTLAVERTYWEKATILHALHHNGKLRAGLSRHYYDLLMLDRAGITGIALASDGLLKSVVRNKSIMFADRSASYATAAPGTLRLLPRDEDQPKLRDDYAAMAEMFMADPPAFAELVDGLRALESRINDRSGRSATG